MFLDTGASVFDKRSGEQSNKGSKSVVDVSCPETLTDLRQRCVSGSLSRVIRPMQLQYIAIEAASQLI